MKIRYLLAAIALLLVVVAIFYVFCKKYIARNSDIQVYLNSDKIDQISYNNYYSGGKMAVCKNEIYYINSSLFTGGIRKISNNKDSYVSKQYEYIYGYKNKLYALKDNNLFVIDTKTRRSEKIIENISFYSNIYDLAILNDHIYCITISNDSTGLYRYKLDGAGPELLSENAEKIYIGGHDLYFSIADTLYKYTAESEPEEIFKSLIFQSSLSGRTTTDTKVYIGTTVYNFQKSISEKLIDPGFDSVISTNAAGNSLYYAIYAAKYSATTYKYIEGDNSREEVGVWRVNDKNGELKKVSNAYGFTEFYMFDETQIFYFSKGKLCFVKFNS